ncbi:PREDICTED: LOW QUALITY PROTEIN: rab9 effector protein with kelch motifs-like, partial [Eurypyga helias]|uniref:LOW QUALITY PROTEIN: rab9 effector protein with kelch motifs-like n=1 Tax=Eurypyga helias TaxID=54383 RepID=UPI00052894CD
AERLRGGAAESVFCYRVDYFVHPTSELETGTWESPEVSGVPPLPRTFHSSSAAIGDCLYVFGGGHKGTEPVKDQQLHVFDTATLTWCQPDTRGEPPSPRHGHAVVAAGTQLFVHGGLAGDVFYSDLFCIDVRDMRWVKVPAPATGDVPAGRASHASAVFRDHLYIFGGIGPGGTLDTTYKYDIAPGRPPLVVVPPVQDQIPCNTENCPRPTAHSQPANGGEGGAEDAVVHLLLVFGGMDTQGEIYRDCVVSLLE